MMADLLSLSVSQFLIMTQSYTLPYLILMKRQDVIERIAQARGGESWRACLDSSNAAPIMALLLVQAVPDMEGFIMALLRDVSPHFKNIDFSDLIMSEQIPIVFELLTAAGQEDDSKRNRVCFLWRN